MLLLLLSHFSHVRLCDPRDSSPPGSHVPGILQARTLECCKVHIATSSVQFTWSVVSDSFWPMDYSTPGLLVHHQLSNLAQTNVHWVGDAIQPSHPLSSPSPPAFNLCQHQGLFQWVSSSHQVAKVLELQLQHQSFQWIFRFDFLINLGEGFSPPPVKLGLIKPLQTMLRCNYVL